MPPTVKHDYSTEQSYNRSRRISDMSKYAHTTVSDNISPSPWGGGIYLPFQTAGVEAGVPESCIFRGSKNVERWGVGARPRTASWERVVGDY